MIVGSDSSPATLDARNALMSSLEHHVASRDWSIRLRLKERRPSYPRELWSLDKLPFDCLEECIYTPLHKDRNELDMAHLTCSVWAP